MKHQIISMAVGVAVLMTACNNDNANETMTDSTTVTTNDMSNQNTEKQGNTVNSSFDESGSYVDLRTNKPVRLRKGDNSQGLVDAQTNQPYMYFFYSPATRDTFDRYGNVVNNYLIRRDNGEYALDEERWRTKVDEDGDMKMKDGDETKIKYDASSGRTKIKTEDTVIKRQ